MVYIQYMCTIANSYRTFEPCFISDKGQNVIHCLARRNKESSMLIPVTTAWCVPWVADGGVGLQIWRLAANILNKQSWTADQEWSSS